MSKNMNETYDLLPWVMGIVAALGVGGWARQQARMTTFEKAHVDLMTQVVEVKTDIKHLLESNLEIKSDNKDLNNKLELHMRGEEQMYRGVAENIAVLKAGMVALEKRQNAGV